MNPIQESVHFWAQLAARERVGRIATQLDGYAVFDGGYPAARVGTIVVAGSKKRLDGHPGSLRSAFTMWRRLTAARCRSALNWRRCEAFPSKSGAGDSAGGTS